MSQFLYLSISDLRKGYLNKDFSPVDVVEATNRRLEMTNPEYNYVTYWNPKKNVERAKEAEKRLQKEGANTPILTGIPITIKDTVAVKGEPFTQGSYVFRDCIAKEDDILSELSFNAGAINVAKTTLPEFCHKMITDSPLFGYTLSPFNTQYSPGGSSGGAAVALAVGIGPVAIGTDGGGSIRCPSACSNLVGIKGTLGSIPDPSNKDVFGAYWMRGPMARTAKDCAIYFSVLSSKKASKDLFNQFASDIPIEKALALNGSVKGLKIAYIEKFRTESIHPDVAKLCKAAVEKMQQYGAHVDTVPGDLFHDVGDFYVLIHTTHHATDLGGFIKKYGDKMSATLLASIAEGKSFTSIDLRLAAEKRGYLWQGVQEILSSYDVIISPTLTEPMQKIRSDAAMNTELFKKWCPYTYPFNITGHPAISIPVGLSQDGLPVGMQIVGPWYSELRLFEIAQWLEETQPWQAWYPGIQK